jgi:transcription elongation GreA/GreB family factor
VDKRKIIQEILAGLAEELRTLVEAAQAAHEAAIHEESKQEDAHDTRSVEASYLAGAQAARAAELQRLITVFKFFPIREYTNSDIVEPGVLVELRCNGTDAFYFIVPQGGGLVTRVDGKPVQILTSQSPIGEALLGRRVGDTFEIETRTGTREYEVVTIR